MSYNRAKLALETTRFADLRSVAETGSTNMDLRTILSTDPKGPGEPADARLSPTSSGTVVLVADHQSAGRGRLDRTWESPPGSSILMTVGLPVSGIPPEQRTLLTVCMSLAVTDAIDSVGITGVSLKWPNDIVVTADVPAVADVDMPLGYLKVGGVLAEIVESDFHGTCALLGLGLNANWGVIPSQLVGTAISLDTLSEQEVDRWDLVTGILVQLDTKWLPLLEAGELGPLLDEYRRRCSTIGRTVRVELPEESLVGTACDVTNSGALVVEVDGVEQVITAGDLVHLRPLG